VEKRWPVCPVKEEESQAVSPGVKAEAGNKARPALLRKSNATPQRSLANRRNEAQPRSPEVMKQLESRAPRQMFPQASDHFGSALRERNLSLAAERSIVPMSGGGMQPRAAPRRNFATPSNAMDSRLQPQQRDAAKTQARLSRKITIRME
jgi:hypothetical protein